MKNPGNLLLTAVAGAMLLASTNTAAQSEGSAESDERLDLVAGPPEDCLRLRSIDDTEILSDRSILFRMRDGRLYRNVLPRPCSGLRLADSFTYRTSINQLCKLDTITVLNNLGGRFLRGSTCGLGDFYRMSEEQLETLRAWLEEDR